MPTYVGMRENLFYIGGAKQSSWDTPVSPTWFSRWLDGTDANPEAKIDIMQEGDTSPFKNFGFKSEQHTMIKIVEYMRPQLAGYALQSILGTGSDTYTAPTKTTTLSASLVAGATTIITVADLGNTGTLAANVTPGYTSVTYEVVTINLTTRSGIGPYTYSLSGTGSFTFAHTAGDTVTSVAKHVLTRQLTTYDPYSLEYGFTQSGIGKVFRAVNCVCYEWKFIYETGKPIRVEHSWYATSTSQQASPSTPIFENDSIIGKSGSPFMWSQGSGNWSLDTLTTGNALTFKKFEITIKNSTGVNDLQTEAVTPAYFIPGNVDISGTAEIILQNYNQYLNMYYGSASAGSGTSDSAYVGTGAIATVFQQDAVNSLAISLPYLNYTAAKLNPKLDAKPLSQSIVWTATKNAANPNPVTITLSNSAAATY